MIHYQIQITVAPTGKIYKSDIIPEKDYNMADEFLTTIMSSTYLIFKCENGESLALRGPILDQSVVELKKYGTQ